MSPKVTKDTPKLNKETLQHLWTVDDVASYLKLNPETVRVMVRKGTLPAQKIGRQLRFQEKEITEWVNRQTVKILE